MVGALPPKKGIMGSNPFQGGHLIHFNDNLASSAVKGSLDAVLATLPHLYR